jgi:hypothetical protein
MYIMLKFLISTLVKIWNKTRLGRKLVKGDDVLNILIPVGVLAIAMFVAMVTGLIAILTVIR